MWCLVLVLWTRSFSLSSMLSIDGLDLLCSMQWDWGCGHLDCICESELLVAEVLGTLALMKALEDPLADGRTKGTVPPLTSVHLYCIREPELLVVEVLGSLVQ